jgi:hypothetical protein
LVALSRQGLISNRTRQVSFEFAKDGQVLKYPGGRAIKYVADFQYRDEATGDWITEDCKGVRTAAYKIKRALMQWIWGIKILET